LADKTVTVRPADGDYTTLQAAITGEVAANADLTAMEGILHIKIEGDWSGGADVAASIKDFTTSADYYVHVYTDSANRASAKWDATKYRISTSALYGLYNNNAYTRIDGIQVEQTESGTGSGYGIYSSAIGCQISNCIINYSGTTSGTAVAFLIGGGTVVAPNKIWNGVVYNSPGRGFGLGGASNSVFVYNCTAVDCATGFYSGYNDANAFMCLASDCTDCFAGVFKSTSHCAYTEGDDPGSNGHSVTRGTDFQFKDYAGDDFHIDASFDGTTDPSSGLFANDIDDDARSDTWDIGADEYVAAAAGEEYVGSGSITTAGIATTSHTTDYEYSGNGSIAIAGIATISYTNDYSYQGQGVITTSGLAIFSRTTYYVFQASGTTTAGGKAATSYTNNYSYQGQGTITTAGIAETSYIPSFVYQGQGVIITAGIATTSYTTYYIYQGQGTTTSGGKATTEYSVEHEYQGQGTITLSGIAEATSGVEYTYQGQGEITTAGIAITSYIPSFVYQGQGEITTTGLATTSYTNDFSYQGQGVITLSGIAATSYTEVEVEYIYQGQGEITTAGLATTSCTNYFSYQGQGEIIISGSAITESSTGYEYQGQGTITLSGIARTYLVYITETITNYSTITILVDEKSAIENEVDETSSIQILVDNKSQIGKIIDETSSIQILVDEKSII